MRWTNVITNAGTALLAGTIGDAGKRLIITRAAVSGAGVDVAALATQVNLADYKFDIPITQQMIENAVIKLRLQFANNNVISAFYLYQIGIFAKLEGQANDILFMILQASNPDYIPNKVEEPGLVNEYIINTHISSTANITVNISVVPYVTVDQFNNELNNIRENGVPAAGGDSDTVNSHTVNEDVPAGAKFTDTVYVHPATHSAAMIDETAARKFVTPEEKASWNDKYTKQEVDNKISSVYRYKGSVANFAALPSSNRVVGDVYNCQDTGINYAWDGSGWDDIGGVEALATAANNGLMSKEDFSKLAGIEAGANKYIHPTTDGNKHLPSGGTVGQLLKNNAAGTGVWVNDDNVKVSSIANNLVTTAAGFALDARQGKALMDEITAINDNLDVYEYQVTQGVQLTILPPPGEGSYWLDFVVAGVTTLFLISNGGNFFMGKSFIAGNSLANDVVSLSSGNLVINSTFPVSGQKVFLKKLR